MESISPLFRSSIHYAKLAGGLLAARRYPAYNDPESVLLDQLRHREVGFRELLRKLVFARPSHPLHQMFLQARCAYGDVENLIARRGLEAALEILRASGVFLSSEEFKGRQPIVRGGVHIPASTADFVNPLVDAAWHKQTSGTTGAPTLVPSSLAHSAHRECYGAVAMLQLGVPERRWLSMAPILPSSHAITRHIWNHKRGLRVHRWYTAPGNRSESRYHRAVTRILLGELRLMGVPAPPLTFLPPNDFLPVARDIASARQSGVASYVTGSPSSCVRVAAAALEHGLDISGTRFWTGGEGLSPAKAASIHRSGAEAFATFWSTELGPVGFSCPHYEGQNTVHHFHDATAIVRAAMTSPHSQTAIPSLFFTTLLPSAPLFFVNFELGDQGDIEAAKCGCRFAQLGFDTVISGIQSYKKLNAYGITQGASDVVRVIEEALPARFGGSPSDYQLAEQESGGRTVVVLRVNPRIGHFSPDEVGAYFLDRVRELFGGSLTVRTWTHAGAFSVAAQAPVAGATGKILPLHLLAPSHSTGHSSARPAKELVDAS